MYRMLARIPKGLRPKQRSRVISRCPRTGKLARHPVCVVQMDEPKPYGQGGRSFDMAGQDDIWPVT